MKLRHLKQLTRRFPHADLVIEIDGKQYKDFIMEAKFTSEGKWIIVARPDSK